MNLRQIQEILIRNRNVKRSGSYVSTKNVNEQKYKFEQLEAFRDSIKELSRFPFFNPELNQIVLTPVFNDNRDVLIVDSKTNTTINLYSERLQNQVEGLIKFIDELTKNDKIETLYVKLPELNSFDEFINVLEELKKAIEIPSFEVGGEAKIITCEPGSIWVTILVGATVAVRLIGKLVKIATDANLEIKKGQIFGQYADNLKLKNEVLELFKNAQEEQLKALIQTGAEKVNNSEFGEQDNERVERLKLAIKSIGNLLNKGAEFLPSFKSSEEIKNIFPDTGEEIKMIEQNVKALLERNIGNVEDESKTDDNRVGKGDQN